MPDPQSSADSAGPVRAGDGGAGRRTGKTPASPSSPTPPCSCASLAPSLGPILALLGRARPAGRLRALRPGSRAPAETAVPRGHRRQSLPARRRGAEQPGPGRARPRGPPRRDLDRPRGVVDRPRDPGAGRPGRDVRLPGARERPAAPLAHHAGHRRGGPARDLPGHRAAAAAAGPATAAAGLALFCRHLFDDQRRWLVDRAARHRRLVRSSPTAGAGSPRRSPSSAAVPP